MFRTNQKSILQSEIEEENAEEELTMPRYESTLSLNNQCREVLVSNVDGGGTSLAIYLVKLGVNTSVYISCSKYKN